MPNGDKEQFTIHVNGNLMKLLDNLASKNERSRNIEVERAIRRYLLSEMDDPDFWHEIYQKHGLVD